MERSPSRNVLAIGVTTAEFDRLVPFLLRQSFDVDRFPRATGAADLISQVPFEMLLVRFPLPDMEVERFLTVVRRDGSPCLRSSVLILTDTDRELEAQRFVGLGANRTINLEASAAEIQESISSVLDVAPRKAARFLARLEVRIGDSKDMFLCQTENISATGMLIRTEQRYEVGTQLEFEFTLPGDPRPMRGVSEIVRHTRSGRDSVGGIGMRFLSFSGDSQRRFHTFLQDL
ncbi:MAG: PilZ domain-containing protein [Acidobacteriota bacterium]